MTCKLIKTETPHNQNSTEQTLIWEGEMNLESLKENYGQK